MKVKNLIIGDIVKIEYARIPGEDYYPSSFDTEGNIATRKGNSLFYKIGNHAFDLLNFGCYKIVKYQETYPDKLKGKKVVIFDHNFSDISSDKKISKNHAVLTYLNNAIK